MTTSTTEPARVGREGLEHNSMVWSNWRRETPRNANKAAHGHTHLARRLHPKRSVCMYTQLVWSVWRAGSAGDVRRYFFVVCVLLSFSFFDLSFGIRDCGSAKQNAK